MADAEAYVQNEGIAWTVAVDDLAGTVHQAYGGLSDPTYLIDADGRVAFYNMWTSAPVLHRAIEELIARGGRGIVLDGIDRRPHMAAALTDGWRALRRGRPQSVVDLMLAAPGSPLPVWAGDKLKPIVRPLTLRARPLPRAGSLAMLSLLAAAVTLGMRRWLLRPGRRNRPVEVFRR